MKKADLKKIKTYTAAPYGTTVVMVKDEKIYHQYYQETTKTRSVVNVKRSDGVTHQLETEDGGDMFLLIGWFRPWKISTLAHECSHAAFRICGNHGVILESDNNEAHAYLLSDMMDRFIGEVNLSEKGK